MEIKVLFFASLREQLGSSSLAIHLAEDSDTNDLRARVIEQLGGEAGAILRDEGVKMSVNQEVRDQACQLQPGDEVAFFPPITGG